MVEKKIKWNEGDGYITAAYEGSGNGSASISSDANEGIDREQFIKIETTVGNDPKSENVLVKQVGLREVFEPSDGGFVLRGGGSFNVLKLKANTLDELSNDVLITNGTLLENGIKILTMLNNNTYI